MVEVVESPTLGLGRLDVSRRILAVGAEATCDGAVTTELALVTPAHVYGPELAAMNDLTAVAA